MRIYFFKWTFKDMKTYNKSTIKWHLTSKMRTVMHSPQLQTKRLFFLFLLFLTNWLGCRIFICLINDMFLQIFVIPLSLCIKNVNVIIINISLLTINMQFTILSVAQDANWWFPFTLKSYCPGSRRLKKCIVLPEKVMIKLIILLYDNAWK